MGGRKAMITDTETIIIFTAVIASITAAYGAVAGIFYDGDDKRPLWWTLLGVVIVLAVSLHLSWTDRGAELYYRSVNPLVGLALLAGPAMVVLASSIAGQ